MRCLRQFIRLVGCLSLACWSSHAAAQQAVRSLASLPDEVELAVCVEGAASLVRADRPLLAALPAWGWTRETKPAFDALAEVLGVEPGEGFERLLGRQAKLVQRREDGVTHWVVLSEVDRDTALELPARLDAKPMRASSGLPVQALERRNFEFTVSPVNPSTNAAWVVIAPARSSAFFDTMVSALMGAPGGLTPLGKGEHAALFTPRVQSSVAVFYRSSERALLVAASRDDAGWSVEARGGPGSAWLRTWEALDRRAAELPDLSAAPPEDELLSVWSQPWRSSEVWLDGLAATIGGELLWSCVQELPGARGVTMWARDDAVSVAVAGAAGDAAAALAKADAVIASRSSGESFDGALLGAARSAEVSTTVFMPPHVLSGVAWALRGDGEQPWLVLGASSTDDAEAAVHNARRIADRAIDRSDHPVLAVGRVRLRAMLDRAWPDDATIEGPVSLLKSIERAAWRIEQRPGFVRGTLRLELSPPDAAGR